MKNTNKLLRLKLDTKLKMDLAVHNFFKLNSITLKYFVSWIKVQ